MRDLNDRQDVQYLATDPYTGTATDVTAVLTVTLPDASTSTPSVTHAGTGDYRASFTLSQAGKWRWRWDISGAIIDEAYGEVDVATADAPPLYASLIDLKQIRPAPTGNVDNDAAMQRALAAASRQIDRMTGDRQFFLDATATARTFHVAGRLYCDDIGGEWILIDDIGSTAGLIVEVGDGTTFYTLTSSDYQTGPDNAIARRRPITRLLRKFTSWNLAANAQVRVTAHWGWPVIPDEVSTATLLLANRLFLRKDSPEGVLGNAEWGVMRVGRTDPDVEALMAPFSLLGVG